MSHLMAAGCGCCNGHLLKAKRECGCLTNLLKLHMGPGKGHQVKCVPLAPALSWLG